MRIMAALGLALAAMGSGAASADEPMTALQLLESYEKTIQQMDGFRVEVIAKKYVTGDIPVQYKSAKDGHIGTTRYSVAHHGDRWKVRRVILPLVLERIAQSDLAKGTEYLVDRALGTTQAVQLQWISRQADDPFQPDRVFPMLMGEPKEDEWVLRYLRDSAVPLGYLPGDDWHKLWIVMREARVLDLSPDMEVVAGHKTHVVTSRGKYGLHKLWLDPEFGYLPRQIEIVKLDGDLFEAVQIGVEQGSRDTTRIVDGGAQIRSMRASYTMTESRVRVENVQLEKIEGRFWTTAFDHIHDQTMKYADRTEKSKYRIDYRTQSVDCNPDSWPADVFRFGVEVRDGTAVRFLDNRDKRAVWRNGKIEGADS